MANKKQDSLVVYYVLYQTSLLLEYILIPYKGTEELNEELDSHLWTLKSQSFWAGKVLCKT